MRGLTLSEVAVLLVVVICVLLAAIDLYKDSMMPRARQCVNRYGNVYPCPIQAGGLPLPIAMNQSSPLCAWTYNNTIGVLCQGAQ